MNNLKFRKLGLSEVEIEAQARAGSRLDRRTSKAYRSMYETGNPTDEDIKELENVVGAVPEDYKAFLKSHNGGIPSATLLKTRSNERVINSLLALKAPLGFGDSIGARMKVYDGRVPEKTFPIASAGGGDLVLLNTASGNLGEILYWDHNFESDEDDASDYFDNTEVVAASFSEFLNKLTLDVG
ncbi:SMI1/KNR4 family protein [Variovorax guangxiensis]|uniref:SMI1/KNR4 family protein n=1 Tax=Variovorax guangxiensis TaxID=1775474 RepID=A0A433MHU7_9BURK|nr:SMI1/KNR4 family protein [Variovorax guangxiensis]RUR67498.1 SMI1/KNR4 family protein [Variovorax guangxiensis]